MLEPEETLEIRSKPEDIDDTAMEGLERGCVADTELETPVAVEGTGVRDIDPETGSMELAAV